MISPPLPKARQNNILTEEIDGELMLYDQDEHRAFNLNPTTALTWRRLDGRTTVEEMTQILRRELNDMADEDLVWSAVDELEKFGLLEEASGRSGDASRMSRRQVISRLGLVGAMSLLIPVVSSIVSPQAAAAAPRSDEGAPDQSGGGCGTGSS